MLATAGLLIYFLRFASFSTKNIHLTALSYSMFTEACREHIILFLGYKGHQRSVNT